MSAELQAIYVMWLRHVKLFARARSRLIANIIQPFFFLAFLGIGLRPMSLPGMPSGLSYLDFLAPGMIAMSVIFSSMFAGLSVIWDRQFGFLKEVLVAPVSRLSIVVGRTLGGSTVALIQGLLVLAAGIALGARISLQGVIPALIFMLLIAFFAVGLGLSIAVRLRDPDAFPLLMNLIMMPSIFLSTAFFPLESVSDWLRSLMYLNPLTYLVDGLRGFLTGSSSIPLVADLAAALALCVSTTALGAYMFSKSEA
ncbi:MAG: ABC transporter permease [Nitrososphaerota archaeon]